MAVRLSALLGTRPFTTHCSLPLMAGGLHKSTALWRCVVGQPTLGNPQVRNTSLLQAFETWGAEPGPCTLLENSKSITPVKIHVRIGIYIYITRISTQADSGNGVSTENIMRVWDACHETGLRMYKVKSKAKQAHMVVRC
jgi:hypothetical protein